MKHVKLFEQFVNEGKEVNTIVDFLENMADKGWKKFNISSGSDLYEDPVKQEKYIEFVKSEIKKANLSNDILKFGKDVHDELESDNFHHLNMLLALAGYYKPDVKSRYMSYLKNRPKDSFALDLFEKSVNEGRVKKPTFEKHMFLSKLSPADHDKAVKELGSAGIDFQFVDDFDKKRGFITVDKNILTPEQSAILDKWKKIGDSFGRQNVSYESKNPKDIEKFIMQLPDTTEYITIPNKTGDFVGSENFSPNTSKNWKRDAIKYMNDVLKGEGGKEVYNIEFDSHSGGPIRGYASWYLKFRTKGSDEFGKKMAAGDYGKLD